MTQRTSSGGDQSGFAGGFVPRVRRVRRWLDRRRREPDAETAASLFPLSSLKCCPSCRPDIGVDDDDPRTVRGMEVDPQLLFHSGGHSLPSGAQVGSKNLHSPPDRNTRSIRTSGRDLLKRNSALSPLRADFHKNSRNPTTCGPTSTPSSRDV